MNEQRRLPYDIDALRQRLPRDRGELFVGFVPWPEDAENWNRSVRQSLPEPPNRTLLRTVWDDPEHRELRVAIDAIECASQDEALDALLERLEYNQLARLPEGPAGVGAVTFMHPEGVPPAVFFVRGNLCVSVVSYGRRPVEVTPWAERLDRRLQERPADAREAITLSVDRDRAKIGEAFILSYGLQWQKGEDGYLKFFAEGGTLALRDGRVTLTGARAGEARIDAYLVEPGREPSTGSLTVTIE